MAANGSHAEHDLVTHFGCDGDQEPPDAAFQFTDIVIQLHGLFYRARELKILEGIDKDIFPVFRTKSLVSYVNAFLGSQISPLCS